MFVETQTTAETCHSCFDANRPSRNRRVRGWQRTRATTDSDTVRKECTHMQTVDKTCTEQLTMVGSQLIDTIKHVIHEGNVRKVTVKQGDDTIAEFPLTIGVAGVAIAPALAALGAIAALVTDCTIEIERVP